MPPLLPSSGAIDIATIRSYLGLSSSQSMDDYVVRRIRADSKGIATSQNPITMDELHGANVRSAGEYTGSTGYISAYVATTISPNSTNFFSVVTPGTYGVGDGTQWHPNLGGPLSAHNYGQLYVKVEPGSTVITQIYYKAYDPSQRAIRHRNSAGSWTDWAYYTM